ncbi:hypothetical protein [Xanthomonas hortorum]|uniref:ATP-grasp domain-containing protein n=1 Tax=Xanthomonas hortorum TaxID=56454 RepID=A0AA47IBJ9_9XANT|nr:hypothetical protein [Xanthomonas hortorum]WAH66121.1 hypothetical protein OEG85_09400 [Xanthomonas hortorum]
MNIFGDAEYTFCIWSERLDWRGDITVPIEPVALDSGLRSDLESMLASLGLTMGIFDLKIDTSGQPIFLELNPQGQFLFLEGLTGAPLTDAFAEFLYDRLVTPTTRSARPVEAARYT